MGNNTQPKCACRLCNNLGVIAISLDKRGGRNVYLCEKHATRDGNYPYGTKNPFWIGEPKDNGETHGIENETSKATAKARAELLSEGFIPTRDGSIRDTEFISPLMYGFGALSAYADSLQRLIDNNEMYIGMECGTHYHCGHVSMNITTQEYIADNYGLLFYNLSEAMIRNEEKTRAVFGRTLQEAETYAPKCPSISYRFNRYNHEERYHFINVIPSNNVEYRLCKLVTAKQYINCCKLCREFNRVLVKSFIPYCNENHTEEERTIQARKVSKKLVKLFNQCEIVY